VNESNEPATSASLRVRRIHSPVPSDRLLLREARLAFASALIGSMQTGLDPAHAPLQPRNVLAPAYGVAVSGSMLTTGDLPFASAASRRRHAHHRIT
jgi:hypothetical protein